MSNNTNTQGTSFWKFLTDNTIEIPIIQRDYAQGRLGKEYLRKSFLVDIKKALDNKTEMKLDFVYGSVENDTLSPLDGQQRLTTLWLLHWYIALMSGNLNEEVCKRLAKFTYETRISSREFCKNLCKPKNFNDYQEYISTEEDRKIVEYITSRTWFYSAWKQDPTIQSMLRMLGGTEKNDKNGEDIVDGLEELFKCPESCEIKANEKCKLLKDFQSYWNLLISENVPIVFYQLPLKDFGLSDDLYIKMNARGKQLTSFENFKADLVGYILEQAKDNQENQDWNNLLDAENGIPIKMDTTWTDIFWENRSSDNRIDEIYFAFLNRFFLCELICQKENNDYRYSAEKLEKENSTFRYLYGKESNDANIEYVGWEKYGCIPLSYFNDLRNVLNKCKELEKTDNDNQFQFFPEYKENNTITTLTQSERIVFHAISKYLQNGDFYVDSFNQWIRVVCNIVENANINSIATMIGAMRLIDELGEHSHEIYKFLASKDSIKSEAVKEQVQEEIAKAKQILDENGNYRKYEGKSVKKDGTDYQTWEDIIIEAEKYAFFKGAIRFLFTDGDGNINWDDFDTKLKNAQKYFDKNGVKETYQTNAYLLRYYISKFNEWWMFWNFPYDNEPTTWKYILTSNRFFANHSILMQIPEFFDLSNFKASLDIYTDGYREMQNSVQNDLVKTTILVEASKWSSKLNWYYSIYCLYPHNAKADWKKYVIGNHRNKILSILCDSNRIVVEEGRRFQSGDCKDFFWGLNINFKYKEYFFQWYGTPNDNELDVYLMEENWNNYKERANQTTDKKTDEDTYYCFRVTPEMEKNTDLFTKELDRLIKEARQNGDL